MRHQKQMPVSQQEIVERITELSNCVLMIPHTCYQSDDLSTSYGDWDVLGESTPIDPATCYVLTEYASGSDYSGSLVEVSNHKALIDMMPDGYESGVEYLDYSGGHGTFALAIRFDAVTPELLEALESLQDYPLLDEDLHSQIESDAQWTAWNDCYRSEFKTELGKALYAAFESSPISDQRETESDTDHETRLDETESYLQDDCGEMTDETIDSLFLLLCELSNTNWENESGSDCSIDVERVIDGLKPRSHGPNESYTKWQTEALANVHALIRSGMSDRKFDLGIVRFIDPNQLRFAFVETPGEVPQS